MSSFGVSLPALQTGHFCPTWRKMPHRQVHHLGDTDRFSKERIRVSSEDFWDEMVLASKPGVWIGRQCNHGLVM